MMQLARRASLVLVFLFASVGKFGWQVLEPARSRPWRGRGTRLLARDHCIPSRPLTGYVASAFNVSTLALFTVAGVAVKPGDVEAASSSPSETNSSVMTIR